MSRARRDWGPIDARVRGAFVACKALGPAATAEEIARAAHLPREDALRVWLVRNGADPLVVDWWLAGRLTFAQLWACIGYAPAVADGGEAQRREAIETSADVRRVAGSSEAP